MNLKKDIKQPLRGLFLSHMFPNSIEPLFAPFVAERAKAIKQYIDDIDIVAPTSYFPILKKSPPPYNELFNKLSVTHPRYLGVPSFLDHYRWIPYCYMLHKLWLGKPLRYNIAHIEWIYPDAYAFIKYAKSRKKNIKTVGIVHGNEAIGNIEEITDRRLYINTLKMLDKIISVSEDLKQKMVNSFGILEEKINVITNGVDLSKFPLMDKLEARQMLNLAYDEKIGVCVARLSHEKNLGILIEAMSQLNDMKLKIYILGDGPLKNHLNSLIEKYNVRGRVILAGAIPHDKIFKWLNAADFFCLPSLREGCPVVIHEALACGLPVLSTNVGAIPDLIKDEKYGLLCDPDDIEGFTNVINRALIMNWGRENISNYGRQFTWDEVAKKTVDIYRELLN